MNAINIIHPYRHLDSWVFDDYEKGLTKEPFILGTDAVITELTKNTEYAERGFNLIFSEEPFPRYTHTYEWEGKEASGNWYYCPQFDLHGWLCPALLKYFDTPPKTIYVKVEDLKD